MGDWGSTSSMVGQNENYPVLDKEYDPLGVYDAWEAHEESGR